MTMNLKRNAACLAAVLLLFFAAVPEAGADNNEIQLLAETEINLSQAIAAAEKHNGGQAIEASLDDDSFKPAYEVSLVKDGRVFDVQVDGMTGEILSAREDIDD